MKQKADIWQLKMTFPVPDKSPDKSPDKLRELQISNKKGEPHVTKNQP